MTLTKTKKHYLRITCTIALRQITFSKTSLTSISIQRYLKLSSICASASAIPKQLFEEGPRKTLYLLHINDTNMTGKQQ